MTAHAGDARIPRTVTLLLGACLVNLPTQAGTNGAGSTETSRYVFLSDRSTLVQTGGIAGVHWTYVLQGQFVLTIDFEGGTASFTCVDANAADDSSPARTLDPNEVFAMTTLPGTVLSDTAIGFAGRADDGSDVHITVSLKDDVAHLVAVTVPPPNSADFFVFTMDAVARQKYGGGTGEPDDPYRVHSAEHLNAIGAEPNDYDKHFQLMADIDLDPNLPGGQVFDRAVIAPVSRICHGRPCSFVGTFFTGTFEGHGHKIANLTIEDEETANPTTEGKACLGLFGGLGPEALVRNLGMDHVRITGLGGTLVGVNNAGAVSNCYATGVVNGPGGVYIMGVGGLVGRNMSGTVSNCYSIGAVSGGPIVGGLVGENYSGTIFKCYSAAAVNGINGHEHVGGLVGGNSTGRVINCFWDIETSGLLNSDGGVGLTTAEMMNPEMVGLSGLANDPNWTLDAGNDYPRLAWQATAGQMIPQPVIDWMDGNGTQDVPYEIARIDQLVLLSKACGLVDRHFILVNALDLKGWFWSQAVFPYFSGSFDGEGLCIRNLRIQGTGDVGLFGMLEGGVVSNLGLETVSIEGTRDQVGGLVGRNQSGSVYRCYSTGTVTGAQYVGGLVGRNDSGSVANCHNTAGVDGHSCVGGLVGANSGSIANCYSSGQVGGRYYVGGLSGFDSGSVSNCYSAGQVSAIEYAGGLVGLTRNGSVSKCYSAAAVSGHQYVGGLAGGNWDGTVTQCFWDTQTSGRDHSDGGTGKTTAEMYDISTFLGYGWDFVDETENGTEDIWWILEGRDYPRLWWEMDDEARSEIE